MSITFDGENTIDAFETYDDGLVTKANTQTVLFDVTGAPIYKDYFIITVDAADKLEYDITIDGSKITFGNVPTKEIKDAVEFTITAVGVNGRTVEETATLKFHSTINTSVELKDQVAELGYKNGSYEKAVSYNVEDLGLDALEWKNTFGALKGRTVKLYDEDGELVAAKTSNTPADADSVYNEVLWFKDATGKATTDYKTATTFGFNIWSDQLVPGTYEVTITDGSLIKAVGSLKVNNPATKPVKLLDALCKDGVLQIVGTPKDDYITYQLENAFVPSSKLYTVDATSFVDEDKANDDESWVVMETGNDDKGDFKIKIANATTPSSLFKTREFSATFNWFKNPANTDTIHFKAQAVSPFSDKDGKGSFTVVNPTLEIGSATKSSIELNAILTGAKFVAGDEVGDAYNVFNKWEKTNVTNPRVDDTYIYYEFDSDEDFYNAPVVTTNEDADQDEWEGMGIDGVSGSEYVLDKDGNPIAFESFDTKSLKVLNSDLTIAQLTSLQNKAKADDAPVLYLTNAMFNKFASVWAKYYDNKGNELSAKINKTGKKVYYALYKLQPGQSGITLDEFKQRIENFGEEQVIYALNNNQPTCTVTAENITKTLCTIPETDQVAIDLFEQYMTATRKLDKEGSPAVMNWKVTNPRNGNIGEVTFTFDDTDLAGKFVTPKDAITNPYGKADDSEKDTEPTATITVATGAKQFLSGLKEQKLDAHFTIKDAWGHTTTVPVAVTVTPEQK